jgi:hypothetical protein
MEILPANLNSLKKRVFFFHFNRPASQSQGRPVLSIHYKGKCILVNNLQTWVPMETKFNKRQPRCVMKGECHDVVVYGKNDELGIGALII